MIIVGELINCTRKAIAPAVEARDASFIQDLALKQVDAGAHYLDVNSGLPGQDVEAMEWLVDTVQVVTPLPLCLDSAGAEAMRAGLERYRGEHPSILNSITLEAKSLDEKLPLVGGFKCLVIALLMSDDGVPGSVEERVDRASQLIETLAGAGLDASSIFVDPCVLPVSANTRNGLDAINSFGAIKARHPEVKTICGLSNVSYGLPERRLLNQVYMLLAMAKGLDAVIVNPLDRRLMANMVAAKTLLGQDEWCTNYISAHREGKLDLEGT